jgi:phage gp37-like protein
MYKATILIALSGVGTTLDKEVTAKLPGFAKYPYPPLLFMTSPGDMKLFQNTCLALTGGDTDLSAALKETDMKKKIEKLEEYLNKEDNNKKLAEFLTGNDKEHIIFTEKDGNKSHSNTYYQFYAKVSDKVKEHKASQEGMEKRVYTKKHSAMIWFDQSAEYIGGLRLNPQTTDLDDGDTNNKKFKDALEAYEDLLKAIKGAKTKDEKNAYYSRFKYLFERLYIPARRAINSRTGKMSRSELAFTDRMAKAGIDLMETCREGWTPTKFDIKNAEFQDFLESQWRKLLDGKTIQSEANKNIENTKMNVDKIISLGRKNTAFQKRIKRTLDQEEEWDFAT